MAQLLSNIRPTREGRGKPAQAPAQPTVTQPPVTGSAPGVLIADDDPEIRRVMQEALVHAGFNRLYEARDGAECLATIQQHPGAIKAVVLDIMMPELSGAHVIEQIGTLPSKPQCVLLISGHTDSLSVLEAKCRDRKTSFRVETLPKPFEMDQLIANLKRMIMLEGGPSALVGLGSPAPAVAVQTPAATPAPTMQPMQRAGKQGPSAAELDGLQKQLTSVEGQLAGLNTAVAQLRRAFDALSRRPS